MKVTIQDNQFLKDMRNIINYSEGFLEGAQKGENVFLQKLGKQIQAIAEEYIDTMSRVDPASLHHVYEWYQVGNPNARLFEITSVAKATKLSFTVNFLQSVSVANGAKMPFYDKASVMESGTPVTIAPKDSQVLVFNSNGMPVFTKKEVTVENPGGDVQGRFQNTFEEFFNNYIYSNLFDVTGSRNTLSKPKQFSDNFKSGKINGRVAGVSAGYEWITKAGGSNV